MSSEEQRRDLTAGRSEGGHRGRQRGATIIEAAVILVPFLAIFFALFDFGMAIFMKNTMQFAVRQGVRYAITSQTMSGKGQDASINAVIAQNSFGFLSYLGSGSNTVSCTGRTSGRPRLHHDQLFSADPGKSADVDASRRDGEQFAGQRGAGHCERAQVING